MVIADHGGSKSLCNNDYTANVASLAHTVSHERVRGRQYPAAIIKATWQFTEKYLLVSGSN